MKSSAPIEASQRAIAALKHRHRLFLIAIALTIIPALLIISCSRKKPPLPLGHAVAGYRVSINTILFSPIAYDGSIVAVEGIARDVEKTPAGNGKKPTTKFKIADLQNNYITVTFERSLPLAESDYVIVGGVYRRAKNEIDGRQMEKLADAAELEKFLTEHKKRKK